MSSSTPNIGLTLPIGTEKVSRQIINENMSKIDTAFGNMSRATMRPVPFTIAVADWSGSGSSWSATFNTAYVTTTSQEILTYTSSLRTAKAEDLEANKKSGGGGIVFTTTKKPVADISGTAYVWDTDDGKIPVIIEGTVTPIANGGTGASNVTGAKNNLGITAVENSVATLNSKIGDMGNIKYASKTGQTSYDITIPSNTIHFIVIMTNNVSYGLALIVNVSSNGTMSALEVAKGTNISYDITIANKLTITFDQNRTVRIFDFTSGENITV